MRKAVAALRLGTDAATFLERQRTVHLARMRELLELQRATTDPAGQVAVDHAVFHLDADLKWLETAAERVANQTKDREAGA